LERETLDREEFLTVMNGGELLPVQEREDDTTATLEASQDKEDQREPELPGTSTTKLSPDPA
jgi:hypothetical protein